MLKEIILALFRDYIKIFFGRIAKDVRAFIFNSDNKVNVAALFFILFCLVSITCLSAIVFKDFTFNKEHKFTEKANLANLKMIDIVNKCGQGSYALWIIVNNAKFIPKDSPKSFVFQSAFGCKAGACGTSIKETNKDLYFTSRELSPDGFSFLNVMSDSGINTFFQRDGNIFDHDNIDITEKIPNFFRLIFKYLTKEKIEEVNVKVIHINNDLMYILLLNYAEGAEHKCDTEDTEEKLEFLSILIK